MKIKPLTKEQIIINIDRLTRFKEPESKYIRVFEDIIINNLIEPKFKRSQLDKTEYSTLKQLAEEIINYSINLIIKEKSDNNFEINKKIIEYENSIYKISEQAQILLDNKIDYESIIKILSDDIPNNLKFLKSLCTNNYEKSVHPIKKIILCEGITEEILLPKFAELLKYDFNSHGIYIISAGGKNQVVKYYYKYAEILKIPIFILLDNDAIDNLNQIKPKLRKIDKIHLVKSGEFEDLLPNLLIKKTLTYTTKNISTISIDNIDTYDSKVAFLEEFYRHRGMHEFKKADFAQAVKINITDIADVSSEIKEIINELKF